MGGTTRTWRMRVRSTPVHQKHLFLIVPACACVLVRYAEALAILVDSCFFPCNPELTPKTGSWPLSLEGIFCHQCIQPRSHTLDIETGPLSSDASSPSAASDVGGLAAGFS